MMCVGEIFGDYGEFVNGLVASARGKQFRLGIWTKNDDREHCEIIGKKVLDILPSNMNVNMEFVVWLL
jgi:Eukaryotic initiation factor 4E